MKQLSTSNELKSFIPVKKETEQLRFPSKKTVDMIRQFSRTYHVEKELPANISGMVLN